MNESVRLAYLSALGVDGYMPRWILPAAPAAVACALPQVVVADQESSPAATPASGHLLSGRAQAEVAVPSGVGDVLGELGVEPMPEVAAVAPVKVDRSPATEVIPRFALTIWRAGDELMVVDSRQSQLALPTDRLLANILIALGYRTSGLSKGEVLRWPIFENQVLDSNAEQQGEAAARDMLHAYLDGHLMLKPVKHLLLMGSDAARYILPADNVDDGQVFDCLVGKSFVIEDFSVTAIVTHSLADMLQFPKLKAATWQAIQPLRLPS